MKIEIPSCPAREAKINAIDTTRAVVKQAAVTGNGPYFRAIEYGPVDPNRHRR